MGLGLSPLMLSIADPEYIANLAEVAADTEVERKLAAMLRDANEKISELERENDDLSNRAENYENDYSDETEKSGDAFGLLRTIRSRLKDAGESLPEVSEKLQEEITELLKEHFEDY